MLSHLSKIAQLRAAEPGFEPRLSGSSLSPEPCPDSIFMAVTAVLCCTRRAVYRASLVLARRGSLHLPSGGPWAVVQGAGMSVPHMAPNQRAQACSEEPTP